MGLTAVLRTLEGRLEPALADIGVPCYVLDRSGTFRWLNAAAQELIGDAVGRPFTRYVAPEDVHGAREVFARKLLGRSQTTGFTIRLTDPTGRRVTTEINSVPIRGRDGVVGVFGFGRMLALEEPGARAAPALTPRQHEILRLLAQGLTTERMAAGLGLSVETVRNHIRGLLRALDVHSRLEAVAVARRFQVIP